MRLFAFIPIGKQWIRITTQDLSNQSGHFHVELRDNGSSALISTWDHRILIEETKEGCRYTDKIEIKAGLLTPFVAAFAWLFYRHRQKRWQRLVANGFQYQ